METSLTSPLVVGRPSRSLNNQEIITAQQPAPFLCLEGIRDFSARAAESFFASRCEGLHLRKL
jgi:hypothetical protein